MKTKMNILRLSAGMIDDNKMLYASVITVDDKVANLVENDRMDVGQQHAKVKLSTDDNNKLARSLAVSGLIPGEIEVEVETTVKQGALTMQIVNFVNPNLTSAPKSKPAF